MKRISRLVILLIIISFNSFAQSANEIDEYSDFKERIFTGGNFGLSLGTGNTYIEVAPLVGYRFTNAFSAGGGFSYRYRNVKVSNNLNISTTDYGLNLFSRYNVYDPFFAMAEYEFLNYEIPFSNGESNRESYNSFLVGGGVSQPLGSKATMNFIALYNLSYSELTPGPYNSPWVIRGGISLGF
jgi:hypothetical protein